MEQELQKAAYVDPFVAEALSQPQDGPTEPEAGPTPGAPVQACGRKGCYLPWSDHLTKKGNVRVAYKGHSPAGGGPEQIRKFNRAAVRAMTRRGRGGFLRPSGAAGRKAPGSFATHVVVVQGGKKIRLTLEEFAAALDSARQRSVTPRAAAEDELRRIQAQVAAQTAYQVAGAVRTQK